MSFVAELHAARKERLARLHALPPKPSIGRVVKLQPKPVDHDAGWEGMWFYDLITGHSKEPRQVRISEIQRAVSEYYGLSILDLLSQRRARQISLPRQVAMYLCRMMTPHSYAQIGRRFGGRDHTTVIHASQKFEGLYGFDMKATCDINSIKKVLA